MKIKSGDRVEVRPFYTDAEGEVQRRSYYRPATVVSVNRYDAETVVVAVDLDHPETIVSPFQGGTRQKYFADTIRKAG